MLATTLILAVSGIVCPRVLKFVNYDLSKHGVWQGKGYNATFDANDTTHDTSHGSLKTQIRKISFFHLLKLPGPLTQ